MKSLTQYDLVNLKNDQKCGPKSVTDHTQSPALSPRGENLFTGMLRETEKLTYCAGNGCREHACCWPRKLRCVYAHSRCNTAKEFGKDALVSCAGETHPKHLECQCAGRLYHPLCHRLRTVPRRMRHTVQSLDII